MNNMKKKRKVKCNGVQLYDLRDLKQKIET